MLIMLALAILFSISNTIFVFVYKKILFDCIYNPRIFKLIFILGFIPPFGYIIALYCFIRLVISAYTE